MENPKYVITKDVARQYRFVLRARNGEIILRASEGYNTNADCRTAIKSCQINSPYDSRYERMVNYKGEYSFVLKAVNGRTIGVSETYTTYSARENGIEACKRDGPTPRIEDMS